MDDPSSPYTVGELDQITAILEHAQDASDVYFNRQGTFGNVELFALMRALREAEGRLYEVFKTSHQRAHPDSFPLPEQEERRGVF